MQKLFDEFPYLEDETIMIKKMQESDVDDLTEITENENVYQYIPPFLFKKSRGNLLAAIRNIGERDFDKKKLIIAGIYLKSEQEKMVGLVEIFDYKLRKKTVTIGYRLNETYWNRGLASRACKLAIDYLNSLDGIDHIMAYVMPENVHSEQVLLKNGFQKEDDTQEVKNWGGCDTTVVDVFRYETK